MNEDKITETCVCGSTHQGDMFSVRYWRNEHNAAHAERVIQIQKVVPYQTSPYVPQTFPYVGTPYTYPYTITTGTTGSISGDAMNVKQGNNYDPLTCGMSPFEKKIIADHEERVRVEKQIKDDAEKERLKKNEAEFRKHSRPGDRPLEYL